MAAVRVGLLGNTFVINPSAAEMDKSSLDLVLAGTSDRLAMIEGYCSFLTDAQMEEVRHLLLLFLSIRSAYARFTMSTRACDTCVVAVTLLQPERESWIIEGLACCDFDDDNSRACTGCGVWHEGCQRAVCRPTGLAAEDRQIKDGRTRAHPA